MRITLRPQTLTGAVRDLKLSRPSIFVDNEKKRRSGHVGHGLAAFGMGKIIDFYPNYAYDRCEGHSAFGWMEYRISTNGGQSFGRPKKLAYSYETMLQGVHTISVEKAVSPREDVIVAVCLVNSQYEPVCCEPWGNPTVIRSEDGGKTWSAPIELSSYRGRVYDAIYHEGSIYALEFCHDGSTTFLGHRPEHLYRLFKSDDEGRSFYEVSVIPFPDTKDRAYGALTVSPKGKLIAYTYNFADETHMDCAISADKGKTWEWVGTSYVAKKIRNPQVGILDGQYILHGRSGGWEDADFVLYTSADGVHWDEGTVLVQKKTACFYSNNVTVKDETGKERMLVQYSENIFENVKPTDKGWRSQVNVMHFWLESK